MRSPPVRERRAPNLEAYTALLRGRYHLFRFTTGSWQTARPSFEEAVRRDPEYAEAYVNLATYHASAWALDLADPKDAAAAARAAAECALALDNRRGDAHAAVAMIQGAYDYHWKEAEQAFARALVTATSVAEPSKSASAVVTLKPAPPGGSVQFLRLDTLTRGNWKGRYGGDGYSIAGDVASLPSYVSPVLTGAQPTPGAQHPRTSGPCSGPPPTSEWPRRCMPLRA